MATNDKTIIPFSIPKQDGEEDGECTGRIEIGPLGIEIYIDGHGMKCMDPDQGSIVYLNHYDGSPQLVVHSDINQEDPGLVIQLAGAAEELREKPETPNPPVNIDRHRTAWDDRETVYIQYGVKAE